MTNKKGFSDINNPALRFMSEVTLDQTQPEPVQPPKQERTRPPRKVKERKSKRMQILVYPSTYEALKELAYDEGESINEIVNIILKKHFEKE